MKAKGKAFALGLASKGGNNDVVKLLIAHHADVNQATSDTGYASLFNACSSGHTAVVETFLRTSSDVIDVNKVIFDTNSDTYKYLHDAPGDTPLLAACSDGYAPIVKLLLQHKLVEPNKASANGTTPFITACESGHADIMRLLLAMDGIDVHHANENGVTAFHAACGGGHNEILQLLLQEFKEGIDINKPTEDGTVPLAIASRNGHLDIVKVLVGLEDVDINFVSKEGGPTPLYNAVARGWNTVVEFLLAQDDINVCGVVEDNTYLSCACGEGGSGVVREEEFLEIVKMLLDHNDTNRSDLNTATTDNHETPLTYACCYGNEGLVELLLKQDGIEVNNIKEDDRDSRHTFSPPGGGPLHIACSSNEWRGELNTKVVQLLLAHKDIDVNLVSEYGDTPLLLACKEYYFSEVVAELVAHKDVDVNAENDEGETALSILCTKDQELYVVRKTNACSPRRHANSVQIAQAAHPNN